MLANNDPNNDKPISKEDEARRQLMRDRVAQLHGAIDHVLQSGEKDPDAQVVMLCEETYDLGLHVSPQQARQFLMNAKAVGTPIHGWNQSEDKTIELYGGAPLWGNLLIAGGINLLTAAPKVGKTALVVHLIGCVLRGDSHCLGAEIHDRFDHAVIVGTDMAAVGWADLLVREGLAAYASNNDCRMTRRRLAWVDPRITLWPSEEEMQLNAQGLAAIRAECEQHSNSLLLVDTLRSVTTALGLDEHRPEIARPVFQLREAVAGLNVTTVVNHHENKSGSGLQAVAGSSALVGAVDAICSMRWLTPVAEGVEQTDDRRVLSATGRFRGGSLVCSLTESFDPETEVLTTCWRGEGASAKEVLAKEARFKAIGELQNRELRVWEAIWDLWDVEQFATMPVIKDRTGLGRKMAENTVNKLLRKGLIEKAGTTNGDGVGRPSVRYRPVEDPDAWEQSTKAPSLPPVSYRADTQKSGNKGVFPIVPSEREERARAGACARLSIDPPELGSVCLWNGSPALVMEHRGADVMVSVAAQIKGQWIAINSNIKHKARWGMEATAWAQPTPHHPPRPLQAPLGVSQGALDPDRDQVQKQHETLPEWAAPPLDDGDYLLPADD